MTINFENMSLAELNNLYKTIQIKRQEQYAECVRHWLSVADIFQCNLFNDVVDFEPSDFFTYLFDTSCSVQSETESFLNLYNLTQGNVKIAHLEGTEWIRLGTSEYQEYDVIDNVKVKAKGNFADIRIKPESSMHSAVIELLQSRLLEYSITFFKQKLESMTK